MRTWRTLLDNERGVALILALMMLVALTGLLLAFLSVSALEPQISRNVADTARARYLAEAGIELGYNMLAATGDLTQSFTPVITSASGSPAVANLVTNGTLSGVTSGGSAAELAFAGRFDVVVRNDYLAADQTITGVAPDASATADVNKIVIMRSTGTFNGATKIIEVVVRRAQLPPFPGAVNLPGLQSDTFLDDNFNTLDVDGRDYHCTSGCDSSANWTQNTSNANKYGIAVVDGTQTNKGTSYESNVQSAVNTDEKKASIKGRNETSGPTSYTTGLNTIQGLDPSSPDALTPQKMAAYIDAVSKYAGTTILQSTPSCRLVLTGTSTPTSTPTLSGLTSGGSSCGTSKTLDLGSRNNPKLVYFRGDEENPSLPESKFIGLETRSGIKGAGVLIIEHGDLQQMGNLTWDGVVIITGKYVGAGFRDDSSTTIRGAFVANETVAGEQNGFFEFLVGNDANLSVRSSKQNIDLVQLTRGNTTITNWREM